MKKLVLFLLAAAFALVGTAHSAAAQTATNATFTGKAVRWDGSPIAGATIAALRGPLESDPEVLHTTTAADGSYTLVVPATGTYWVHIRTFGTWWGYSYTPFSPQPGETISQVYFALGPRDVKDPIALPPPVSNLPTPPAPPTVQPTTPPVAPPAATTTPVSNVKPIIGTNDDPTPPKHPAKPPRPTPGILPSTGAADGLALGGLLLLALLAVVLVGLGTTMRSLRR